MAREDARTTAARKPLEAEKGKLSKEMDKEGLTQEQCLALGKQKAELEERSLTDVPTDKLVDMYLKTASALEGAIVEPIFKSSTEQEEEKEERKLLNSIA